MALPSPGSAISLNQVNVELGLSGTATITMNDSNLRTLFAKAGSGTQISMSDGWGKSNKVLKGFFGGGSNTPINAGGQTTIDGIDFATESVSSPGASLVQPRSLFSGFYSSTKGYFTGGLIPPPFAPYTTNEIDGIDFSTQSQINPGATLGQAKYGSGCVSSSTKGYTGGGEPALPAPKVTTIEAFTFATESNTPVGATLVQARSLISVGGSQSSTRGYFAGGQLGPPFVGGSTQIDGINFATESQIDPGAALVQSRRSVGAVSSSTKAYYGGGIFTPGLPGTTQIDGINFATESQIDPGAALVQSRNAAAGVNSSTKGYFGGGRTGPPTSTSGFSQIDGIDFATEGQIDPGAALAQARYGAAGVSSL